jgi:pilus assembly protein CpaC
MLERLFGQRRAPRFTVFSVILIAALLSSGVFAADSFAGVYTEVRVGESVILTVPYQIKRYSVTVQEMTEETSSQGVKKEINREPKSPALVQVISTGPAKTEIKIDGQFPGKSTLIVWDKNDKKTFYDINVVMDTTDLKARIDEIAPGDKITLRNLKNTVIVEGNVSSQHRKARIDSVLASFGRDVQSKDLVFLQGGQTMQTPSRSDEKGIKYVDLLEVSDSPQVELQITVASIDRTAMRELGINWGYASRNLTIQTAVSSASGGLGEIGNLISGSKGNGPTPIPNTPPNVSGNQGGGLNTSVNGATLGVVHWPSGTQYLIKALASKGLAKVLASPDLLVREGETGRFLAGGEFPVPVVQNSGTAGSAPSVSVEWKEFGVKLNMSPVVKENGNIEILMGRKSTERGSNTTDQNNNGISVSTLDFGDGVQFSGFTIPALKTDYIDTDVELKEGETFVVAGILNDDWQRNITKVPLLGDIPIIGAFFRDQQLQKNERELVFFVTPKLAKAMPPGMKPAVPGADEPTKEQDDAFKFIPMLPNSISIDPMKVK